MKTSNQLFLISVLSGLSAAAVAADSTGQAPVDTSQWKCESCTFEQGVSGTIDAGAGDITDKPGKFGDYTGLNKKGEYLILDGAARYRGPDANYWNLNASNLGLDSRSLDVEGGKQGKYKLNLKYDELPHFISDSVQTPFAGAGTGSLTLPPGFRFPTTGLMPLGGLPQTELGTQRKSLGVGASVIPMGDWELAVNFRHETKDGTQRSAGAFFSLNSTQLVAPVDYVTDQVDASASYTGSKLQAKFAYYGSTFHNGNETLTWQNPFTETFPGTSSGQLALPPGNQFHQLLASAGYQFTPHTRGTAEVAFGQMSQSESFVAPTLNSTLAVPGLPGSSFSGRADTMDANVKLTSAMTDKLRLNAAYIHNERDNQSSQAVYPQVSTDMFLGASRLNQLYDFKQDKFKLDGDYRFSAVTKGSVGVEHNTTQRTAQEVDRTREDTVWGRVTSRALDRLDVTLKLLHGERRNTGYFALNWLNAPLENPILRKYNMAGRNRDSAALRGDFTVTDNVSAGLGFDVSNDQYLDANSTIGLSRGNEYNLSGDLSVVLTPQTRLNVFANHQEIYTKQNGSQAFGAPDWTGQNTDVIDLVGIGVKHTVKDKFDVGADYTRSRSHSEISVGSPLGGAGFPDMTAKLDRLKLYASYQLKDNVSLLGSYWYERFDSNNWMLDGVAPATIPNVLTFGEQPPKYSVHVFRVAVRYKF